MKTVHVAAAVILNQNRILAAQRGYGEWKGRWEFPGGKIEMDETPEEALRREIFEELKADIETDRKFMTVECDYPDFHLSMDCYLCLLKSSSVMLTEHLSVRWLTWETLESVNWLPADIEVIRKLKRLIRPALQQS